MPGKGTLIFGAFRRSDVLISLEKHGECCVCHKQFGLKNIPEVHSATGLHRNRHGRSTSTPKSLRGIKGRFVDRRILGELVDDSVPVCKDCHKKLKSKALRVMKDRVPNFKGQVPSPAVMVEVTAKAVKEGLSALE